MASVARNGGDRILLSSTDTVNRPKNGWSIRFISPTSCCTLLARRWLLACLIFNGILGGYGIFWNEWLALKSRYTIAPFARGLFQVTASSIAKGMPWLGQ